MKLFGQIIRTTVNIAKLPVALVTDAVAAPADAGNAGVGHRTRETLDTLKREASE